MNAEQISAKLQMLIDSFVAKGKMVHHAVLGVASDREGFQWAGAAGVANPATGQPMTPDTPFPIASISKMYTAAAIMLLHEQKSLSLDDKIAEHLPGSLVQGIHRFKGTDYSGTLTGSGT